MNNKCEFNKIKEKYYQCIQCGKIIHEKILNTNHKCIRIPFLAKAVDLGENIKKLAVSGISEKNEHIRRLDICKKCEYFNNGTCSLCSCNMSLKTRIKDANCPIGKW